MIRTTLQQKLCKDRKLKSGIKVTSILINEMEIYGYINTWGNNISSLNASMQSSLINKHSANQIVCSDFIFQKTNGLDKANGWYEKNRITPIYKRIEVSDKDFIFDIANLYIPLFVDNQIYLKIKSRYGTGVKVTSSDIKNLTNSFFDVEEVEGKAMMHIKKGDVLFYDKHWLLRSVENVVYKKTKTSEVLFKYWVEEFGEDEAQKQQGSPSSEGILYAQSSIGQNIVCVCRYIHGETGNLCYALFNLDEIFIEEEEAEL